MSKIFISHSHRDNPAAIGLGRWLSDSGWGDFFLDISPDRGLSPGERWQDALKQAADRCEAVLFLISDDWLQSRWCLAEFLLAKQLGKVIFGVLIAPVQLDRLPAEMRNEWQLCDLVAGEERASFRVRLEDSGRDVDVDFGAAGLHRLRRGLERAGLDPSTFPWPPPMDPDRAPYAGLRALDREDAAVFFGRDAPITTTLDTLRRVRESGVERLFVILGASGSGKSSFLRAGLLPRLARDDRHFFVAPVVRPERAALFGSTGLLTALEGAFRAARVSKTRAAIREALGSGDAFVSLVSDLQSAIRARLGTDTTPTIVFSIDQAEELFGAEHAAESERLLELLQRVMTAPDGASAPGGPGVFTLVSIRSDSYERLQTERLMAGVKQQVLSLPPIPREEYKTIIEGPAARHQAAGHRLRIDPKLTAQLLQDAEGADALPLLAFTLERLFVEHGGDGDLSLEDYAALGGVEGSIEAAVKAALADPGSDPIIPAGEADQHGLLREAFIPWLARVDAETEERKRRVASWDELPAGSRPVLERMIAQRLLLRDRRRVPGASADSIVVEVAHEALLRRWPMLTLWLEQDADALKTIDVAKRAATEWVKHGRREAWMNHAAERLAVVEAVLQRADLDRLLGEEGRAYIHACRTRENEAAAEALAREKARQESEQRALQAEQAAERERLRVAEAEAAQATERAAAARRLSRRTLLGAGVAVVLMIVAVWAAVSARTQQRAAEHALGTLNVEQAARELEAGLVPAAVAHLSEAVRLEPDDPVWRASLISALMSHRWARITADIRTAEPARAATFSPDGGRLLVVAGDEARLWEAGTGARVGSPLRHRNIVRAARFSPDGRLVVTASQDRTVRVWDGLTGAPRTDPIRHPAIVTDARFLSDGRRVVTTSGREQRVVDVARAAPSAETHDSVAEGRFTIETRDGHIAVWNTATGQRLGTGLRSVYSSVGAFSRDDAFGAIGSNESIEIVNTATGSSVRAAMRGWIVGLAFSADSRYLAVWGRDSAAVFDSSTGVPAGPLIRAEGLVSVEIQADGSRLLTLATGENGASARVWNVPDGRELMPAAGAHLGSLCGTDVVVTATSNRLSVWNARERRAVGEPIAHEAPVQSVTLTGDCRLGVSLAGREAQVWDTGTGAPVALPLVHSGVVTGAAFATDGSRLATVSPAGARVWDLRAGEAGAESLRHPDRYDRIAFNAGGARVVTAAGGDVRSWNASDGTAAGPPLAVEGVTSIQVSPTGDRVLLVHASQASVYDTATGKQVGRPFGLMESYYEGPITHALSPDWSLLVTVRDKSARIWDVQSGARRGKLLAHRQTITSVHFSRDGSSIVTTSDDGAARLWSSATGEPRGSPMRHEQGVRDAAFSADGTRVATIFEKLIAEGDSSVAYPRDVRVWDASSGAAIGSTISHDEDVTALALSPDGRRVLIATGAVARLWDPDRSSPVGSAIDFQGTVSSAVFSLDGGRIIVAAGDTVYSFAAERLAPIGAPVRVPGVIKAVAFAPGEQRILVTAQKPEPDAARGGSSCYGGECRITAWLVDVPTASAADVPLLTQAAEVLAGYKVSALGALEPVSARAQNAAALLQAVADRSHQATDGHRIVQWLLSEPRSRAVAPLASAAVPRSEGATHVRR